MRSILLSIALLLFVGNSIQAQVHEDSTHGKEHHNVDQAAFEIPASLKKEHEELHQKLEGYTRLPGKTGIAAKALAGELHPHFMKEEQYALPPLGLLPQLAKGKTTPAMKEVVKLTDQLKREWTQMLSEHGQIVKALEKLNQAAKEESLPEVVRFTESLKLHAQTEEEVLYPAAILIGEYIKLKQQQK